MIMRRYHDMTTQQCCLNPMIRSDDLMSFEDHGKNRSMYVKYKPYRHINHTIRFNIRERRP